MNWQIYRAEQFDYNQERRAFESATF